MTLQLLGSGKLSPAMETISIYVDHPRHFALVSMFRCIAKMISQRFQFGKTAFAFLAIIWMDVKVDLEMQTKTCEIFKDNVAPIAFVS